MGEGLCGKWNRRAASTRCCKLQQFSFPVNTYFEDWITQYLAFGGFFFAVSGSLKIPILPPI